jgi:hypothetical protein
MEPLSTFFQMIEEDVSEQVLDRVESTLLYILDGEQVQRNAAEIMGVIRCRDGGVRLRVTRDHSQHIPALPIECPIMLNMGINLHALPRLYTSNPDQLITPVADLVGETLETIAIDASEIVQWHALRPVAKLQRRYHVAGPTDCTFYEEHYREWNCRSPGSGFYWRRYAAYSPQTNNWYKVRGPSDGASCCLKDTRKRLTLRCSAQEDVNLFWKIKLSEGKAACVISADGTAVLDLFANREGPRTPGGRRRPLMHWVRRHVRKPRGANRVQEVQEHLKGVFRFPVGTTDVELFAPAFEDDARTSRK